DGGALVDEVTPGGPAERAGLAVRDIIVGIEEKLVASMGALVVNLRGRPPGEVVVLDVLRAAKRRELSFTWAERRKPAFSLGGDAPDARAPPRLPPLPSGPRPPRPT